jgi:HKD family nuclease
MPSLILHPGSPELQKRYEQAFEEARELYVVSAYLTAWNIKFPLKKDCKFRMIVGKDFGITRKDACREVLGWLPADQKHNFHVAAFGGFHPKAIFWADKAKHHLLVGSSNLTEAAFRTNFEANLYSRVNKKTYQSAVNWFNHAMEKSQPVDDNWLNKYEEAKLVGKNRNGGGSHISSGLKIPLLSRERLIHVLKARRHQVEAFGKIRKTLERLFRDGAALELSNGEICTRLLRTWGKDTSKFQGKGWERTGIKSNWRLFSKGITSILDANETERDNVVVSVINEFTKKKLRTRSALLSEMLCHFFPDKYPVINGPVRLWIKKMNYHAPHGASAGSKFLDLAQQMRETVSQGSTRSKNIRVRNLAELDIIVWVKYEKAYRKTIQRYS